MHKKILLCLDRNQFEPFDYSLEYMTAIKSVGDNSGNNVFQYSLQKLLTNENNDITVDTAFLHGIIDNARADFINNNYDCIVFSPANVISCYANDYILNNFIQNIEKLKKPVYAIGLGGQSDRFYSMDYLDSIKDKAVNYIKAILNTGGAIGLRGFFTAELVKKLGFSENDFTVIGCPSMFMKGANLKIKKQDLNENELMTAINGFRAWNNPDCSKYLQQHKNSFFVCQDEFYKLLYQTKDYTWKECNYLFDKDKKWLNAYKNNQIKLYCDFPTWYNDLIEHKINFSFGCRIHGNVVPILAGIPSFVDTFDSRVRELCEYFNIPNGYIDSGFAAPWKLFCKTDYTKFNNEFESKYMIFEKFMNDCGLSINPSAPIHNMLNLPNIDNRAYLEKLTNEFTNKKVTFIAHEFGLYKGHGGIASYLYNISSWILNNTECSVHIIADCYDKECDLLNNPRFSIRKLRGNLYEQRKQALKYCEQIEPDYLEIADFNALELECIKARKNGKFKNMTIVTNNHSATKECWEWSNEKDFIYAPQCLKNTSCEEAEQLKNSDYCIAPSTFLANYVKNSYNLDKNVLVFANPYFKLLKTKSDIIEEISPVIDIDSYKDYFNIILITRFEGRKHQERLIRAFNQLKKEGLKIKLHLAGNTSFYNEENKDFRMHVFESLSEEERKDIYFYDFLNISQQEKLIAIGDISIMPSTYENQPVAMVETVIRGVPVMGSIYSGLCDYTKDSAMLFDPFNEDDLTNKIRNYYFMTKEEREQKRLAQLNALFDFIHPSKSIIKRLTLGNQEIINV